MFKTCDVEDEAFQMYSYRNSDIEQTGIKLLVQNLYSSQLVIEIQYL